MTPESVLKNKVRLRCGELGWVCHHLNVGTFKLEDGTYINTGLPKGFPDLQIIKPGEVFYVETKIKPRKPSKEQLEWIAFLKSMKIGAYVVYTMEEFEEIVNEKSF